MRKIVASLFVSLDGVIEAPETWGSDYFSEEVRGVPWSVIEGGEVLLLGRVTYQTFAKAFTGEKAADPFAALIGGRPKYVVSSTLGTADWQNSTLISGDVAAGIADLKGRAGGGIGISGSPTLVGRLLRDGLLDELHLLAFPVVVGGGRRLFEGGAADPVALRLTGTEAFANGVLHHTYARVNP